MSKIVSSKSGKTKFHIVNGKKRRIRNKSTGRNYRKEYDNFHGRKSEIKKRTARNKARLSVKRSGTKVKGKDVAHKDNNTKNTKRNNLKVQSKGKNRSFARTKRAGRKKTW